MELRFKSSSGIGKINKSQVASGLYQSRQGQADEDQGGSDTYSAAWRLWRGSWTYGDSTNLGSNLAGTVYGKYDESSKVEED